MPVPGLLLSLSSATRLDSEYRWQNNFVFQHGKIDEWSDLAMFGFNILEGVDTILIWIKQTFS